MIRSHKLITYGYSDRSSVDMCTVDWEIICKNIMEIPFLDKWASIYAIYFEKSFKIGHFFPVMLLTVL